MYMDDQDVPGELVRKLRLRFTDRLMIFSPGIAQRANMTFTEMANNIGKTPAKMVFIVDEVGDTAVYQIDPTKWPQEIDLVFKAGDGNEQRVKGIFRIVGTVADFTFCEKERPSDYRSPVDKRGWLLKLKKKGP